eukprot:TRINITY_DN46856_c0_g1_i1.p1 TRINITY_DN46856_c0_g1~~TRINITY_DN46856_c0_g1_i1.p1  ORF type:complete len:1560 (+),score=529.48 TRINITY_DN46856_c0_g1_i1:96-4682(+)
MRGPLRGLRRVVLAVSLAALLRGGHGSSPKPPPSPPPSPPPPVDHCPALSSLLDGLGVSGLNLSFSIAGAIPVHTYEDVITDVQLGGIHISRSVASQSAASLGVSLQGVSAHFFGQYTCEAFGGCGADPSSGHGATNNLTVPILNQEMDLNMRFLFSVSGNRSLADYPPDVMHVFDRETCLDPKDDSQCVQNRSDCNQPNPTDGSPMCVMHDNCWITLGDVQPTCYGYLWFLLDKDAPVTGGKQLNNIMYSLCNYVRPPPSAEKSTFVQIFTPYLENASDYLLRHYHPIDEQTPTDEAESKLAKQLPYTPTTSDGIINMADNWLIKTTKAVMNDVYGLRDPSTNMTELSTVIARPGLFNGAEGPPLYEHGLPHILNVSAYDRWPESAKVLKSKVLNATVVNLTVIGADGIEELGFDILGTHTVALHTKLRWVDVEAYVKLDMSQPEVGDPFNVSVFGFDMSLFNDGSSGKPPFQTEDLMHVRFNLSEAVLDVALTVALDSGMLKDLSINQLWEDGRTIQDSLKCVLHPFKLLNITALGIGVQEVQWKHFSGVLCPEIDAVVNNAVQGALDLYLGAMRRAGPSALNEGALPWVRDNLLGFLYDNTNRTGPPPPECGPAKPGPTGRYVDMRSNNVVRFARWLVDDFMALPPPAASAAAADRGPDLNDVLGAIQRAGLAYLERLIGFALYTGYGNLAVIVSDITLVDGLATMQNVSVLRPCGEYCTDNTVKMSGPLTVDVTVQLDYQGKQASHPAGPDVSDLMRIRVNVSNVSLAARLTTKLSEDKLQSLSLGDLTDVDCLVALFAERGALKVSDLQLALGDIAILQVDTDLYRYEGRPYSSCTSPGMEELVAALTSPDNRQSFNDAKDNAVKWFLDHDAFLNSDDWVEQLLTLVGECAALSGDGLLGRNIVSPAEIHYPPSDDKGSWWAQNWPVMVFIGIPVILVFIALIVIGLVKIRARERQGEPVSWSHSLFYAEATTVSPYIKAAIPFLLLFALATFLVAHIRNGAEVNVRVVAVGDHFVLEDFFAYSLANSIKEMWNAKVYFLALLIAFASGAWPYVKILLLAWCWFMPPEVVSHKRRGYLMQALDYAGKWSLVDMFMLVLMMAAFKIHIQNPDSPLYSWLPANLVLVDVRVMPGEGIYAFLSASILLLGTNHAMIVVHNNVGKALAEAGELTVEDTLVHPSAPAVESFFAPPSGSFSQAQDDMRPLMGNRSINREHGSEAGTPPAGASSARFGGTVASVQFTGPMSDGAGKSAAMRSEGTRSKNWFDDGREHTRKESLAWHVVAASPSEGQKMDDAPQAYMFTPFTRWALSALLLISFVLFVVGSAVRTFSFRFDGLAHIAMEVTEPGSSTEHFSIWSLASNLIDQSKEYDEWSGTRAGYYTLVTFYLLFTFFIPIVQMIMLGVLWLVPLTLPSQKALFFTNEVLAAWSSMEVFVLAIIASLLELSRFAESMVGEMCDDIDKALRVASRYDLLGGQDPTCFSVHATLDSGVWILFAAVFFLNVTYNILVRATEQAIIQRDTQEAA